MPVEIKELVIRAVVEPKCEPSQTRTSAVFGEPDDSGGSGASGTVGGEDRAALVAAAVKEVLRILRASKER